MKNSYRYQLCKYANLHNTYLKYTVYFTVSVLYFTHISMKPVGQEHHRLTKASFNERDYISILICEDCAYHIPQFKRMPLVIFQIMYTNVDMLHNYLMLKMFFRGRYRVGAEEGKQKGERVKKKIRGEQARVAKPDPLYHETVSQ